MGDYLRRYWMPIAGASEFDTISVKPIRLLGEDLVAFRDTKGRIGLLDEFCPHRRVSLYFGRNEECGLRCVYHGWKFDVDGKCVDMPSVPAERDFKHLVHAKAYKAVERNGLVWVYMGERAEAPPR